jgi:methanogenic corrinoid protein MtbC1
MEGQRKLEAALKSKGLKGKYRTMVGGAPVTQR